jgi:hypothetical protein
MNPPFISSVPLVHVLHVVLSEELHWQFAKYEVLRLTQPHLVHCGISALLSASRPSDLDDISSQLDRTAAPRYQPMMPNAIFGQSLFSTEASKHLSPPGHWPSWIPQYHNVIMAIFCGIHSGMAKIHGPLLPPLHCSTPGGHFYRSSAIHLLRALRVVLDAWWGHRGMIQVGHRGGSTLRQGDYLFRRYCRSGAPWRRFGRPSGCGSHLFQH